MHAKQPIAPASAHKAVCIQAVCTKSCEADQIPSVQPRACLPTTSHAFSLTPALGRPPGVVLIVTTSCGGHFGLSVQHRGIHRARHSNPIGPRSEAGTRMQKQGQIAKIKLHRAAKENKTLHSDNHQWNMQKMHANPLIHNVLDAEKPGKPKALDHKLSKPLII